MTKLFPMLGGALSLMLFPCLAASASLWLGGLEVVVGMKREALLAKMGEFEPVCVAAPGGSTEPISCETFIVRRKRETNDWLGSVTFKGNTVSRVEKFWSDGYEGTSPDKFAATLYVALRGAIGGDGAAPAEVEIYESRDVGTTIRGINLKVNGRIVAISQFEGLKNDGKVVPPQTNLTESIGAAK